MSGRTRVRGFAPWMPRSKTRAVLADVRAVLDEFSEHLPLTCRQLFYRLVGAHGFEKTEKAYQSLCETLNRARRAGLIPFSSIRDDGVTRLEADGWSNAQSFLETCRAAASTFRLDRQEGQPVRLMVLLEAAGMAPLVARAAHPYGVPVLASGGFESTTFKHDLSNELSGYGPAEILHIGDHDPSGVHVFSALAEDVLAMLRDSGFPAAGFTRLAVTPAQIEVMRLPTAPPKATDRRAFTGETVQVEAIAPDILSSIIRDAIETRQDATIRAEVVAREADARTALIRRLAA